MVPMTVAVWRGGKVVARAARGLASVETGSVVGELRPIDNSFGCAAGAWFTSMTIDPLSR